jgi:protein-disulfide isomerase
VLTAGLAVFAACGGDDATAGTAPAGASATATAKPAATAASNDGVAALRAFPVPRELANGATLGKADAKVTLTVFEDFQCPFCLHYTATQEGALIEEYVKTGKVKLEFKNFPILGQESVQAAVAAQCAANQGRFWEMHRKLFLVEAEAGQLANEKVDAGRFSHENLKAYAIEVGLDGATFDSCYRSSEAAEAVAADARQGRSLGIRGTPSFLINGTPQASGAPATVDLWRKVLDASLK